MQPFESADFKAFDLFNNQWGLVTAGTPERYNTCTIGWGSLGTIWGPATHGRPIVTVYVNPARYTWQFLRESDTFTVVFFPERYRRALAYLGSHSGRDGDKVAASGLTPQAMGGGVTFAEANLSFLCRKIYEAPFAREGMAPDVWDALYRNREPHWEFIGQVEQVDDRRL